ncbi:hypothetical protein SAMN05518845_11575 [Variovorax sp. YR750]|nr:hypothetical protein SAMN05518845_11575 [Variovorax sp. YR750]
MRFSGPAISRSVRWSSLRVHLARNSEFLYACAMASALKRSRVGRPCRHPVDQLRTQMWFGATLFRSGLASADALERFLQPELVRPCADGVMRSSKFFRYKKGSRVPSRIAGKASPVELAEKAFPGTAIYFYSVIWDLCKGRRITIEEADVLLWAMSDEVRHVLFVSTSYVYRNPPRVLSRQFRYFDDKVSKALAQLGTFEALTAVVVLMAKAEAIPPSIGLRQAAQLCYLRMQKNLLKNPEIAPVIEEVFALIDEFFLEWVGIHDQHQVALPMESRLRREWDLR